MPRPYTSRSAPPGALTEEDLGFLERRRRLARSWSAVGAVMLAVLAGLVFWLLVAAPALINPYHVARQVASGTLTQTSLELMVILLPISVLGMLGTVFALILFGFAVFSNERRYLRIIASLLAERRRRDGNAPDGGTTEQ